MKLTTSVKIVLLCTLVFRGAVKALFEGAGDVVEMLDEIDNLDVRSLNFVSTFHCG